MNKYYIPLRVRTHYSLLKGLSKPEDIANKCKALNIPACAICDLNTISGNIAFYKEMKANNIKPILGTDITINHSKDNKPYNITLYAKNIVGWKNLISIISKSYENQISDNDLINIISSNDNIICITGYIGSFIDHIMIDSNLIESWETMLTEHFELLNSVFGKNNVFCEIQLFNNLNHNKEIYNNIRKFCLTYDINKIAGIDSYYLNKEDNVDQHILLCSNQKCTLPEMSEKLLNNIETGYNHFFNSDQYYLLDTDTIFNLYTEDEINNTILINNLCEDYDPLNKPVLPTFSVPNGFTNDVEYLRHLCREGWKKKIKNKIQKSDETIYADRIKSELSVLEEANLSSYFLIVRDIIDFVIKNGWLPGPGRGSAAGCLVSYLIGITNIDPIKYELLFERFYNKGRNTKTRISMPDIDVDVPINHREEIIEYIKNKYGKDRVAQMITFTTLKGRGALKEVLRIYDNLSFEEMNNITKNIPDEAKIADELQEIKEEEGTASIIRWALENNPEKFKEWCEINDKGQLIGPLAKRFEQAIRMEGTKYHQSKHAAGVAISAEPLENICPIIIDSKTNQHIAGLEMGDLESIGVIKFDILGIALLDKIMSINNIVRSKK